MTNKLEELKKEMEKAKVAAYACDAACAAFEALVAARAAYNNELNKNNDK